MKKNGKIINCKVCNKELYISKSRFGFKKYCSFECAKIDQFNFQPIKKNCKICSKEFTISKQLRFQDKVCSPECRKENGLRIAREQAMRKRNTPVVRKCKLCSKKVISNAYCPQNYCGGVKGECYRLKLAQDRKGKNNPAYRNGDYMGSRKRHQGVHLHACRKYRKAFLAKHEYLFCEVCKTNANGTLRFEVHHIYFASLYPKHKELHNFKNLIMVCIQCHNNFHSSKYKDKFEELEKERGLKELFKA